MTFAPGIPSCNPHSDPPIFGDCWYNCTLDDIAGEDKRHRLRKVIILADDYTALSLHAWLILFGNLSFLLVIDISKINMSSNHRLPLTL